MEPSRAWPAEKTTAATMVASDSGGAQGEGRRSAGFGGGEACQRLVSPRGAHFCFNPVLLSLG
ncbi:MAG: hypothetical protein VXY41_06815, partial [Pseudomonadota bacterium]|nr:hypothetical protein [Pseudomonadota bacterium]